MFCVIVPLILHSILQTKSLRGSLKVITGFDKKCKYTYEYANNWLEYNDNIWKAITLNCNVVPN